MRREKGIEKKRELGPEPIIPRLRRPPSSLTEYWLNEKPIEKPIEEPTAIKRPALLACTPIRFCQRSVY